MVYICLHDEVLNVARLPENMTIAQCKNAEGCYLLEWSWRNPENKVRIELAEDEFERRRQQNIVIEDPLITELYKVLGNIFSLQLFFQSNPTGLTSSHSSD